MNKILIIGASGHAKVIIDIIENQKEYVIFGLIDSYRKKGEKLLNYEVLGTENDLVNIVKENNIFAGIIAIGNNWHRTLVYNKISLLFEKFTYINAIHPDAIIDKTAQIGHGTVIMAGVIIDNSVIIGKHCIINTKSGVGHDTKINDFSSIAPGATIGGNVKIGECTAISLGANIIENITIGNHTVVGAGSLVNRDIESYKVAYGIPAKPQRNRCPSHNYLNLNLNPSKTTHTLSFVKINNSDSEKTYNDLLKFFPNTNAFYSLQYCNYSKDNPLNYFLYQKNDSPLILLPINLNKIKSKNSDDKKTYYDAVSPYGYSGPLYNKETTDLDLKTFWNDVDLWYKENNVVTEFIRFSLVNNHNNYSGHVIPTLNNVKGNLSNFDTIWNNLKQKVRNNYRKAESNSLKISINNGVKTEEDINIFYDIYTKTMVRNDAGKNYFYQKKYFKNLININVENTILVIVYKDDVPISTELLISNNNDIYSYLGGTLSDFFEYRPNDFLKIEVVKWAIANKKANYILGGGRENKDGLYKYKKAFFPKDEDVPFYTGRKIINEHVYNKLIREIECTYEENLIENSNNYFPLYKKTKNE